jgi:hypothetical protein
MDYIRTLTRDFSVAGKLELSIENRAGAVSVRGDDTSSVRLEVVAHLWAEDENEADDQLELIARGIRMEGNRLTVRAPALLRPKPFLFFERSPRIEYQLVVPKSCSASITSRSGRTDVERISGPLDLTSHSGRAAAREIGGDVRVNSTSGGTQLESIAGSVTIESKSGGVRVSECSGNCTIGLRSGSLQIESIKGNVDAETRSGSVSLSEIGGSLKLQTRSGSVRYEGAVHAPMSVDVWSGSIRFTVDLDSVFFLDAESAHGAVRSDLPMRSKSSASADSAPTVRLRTRSGAIFIEPK